MNKPAISADSQQTGSRIREEFRRDLRRFEEQVTAAIASFCERMDRRFDALDQRFAAMDKRFDAMDRRLECMEDDIGRFASHFSGFAYLAVQSDRSARILALQEAQQRSIAAFLRQRPPQ